MRWAELFVELLGRERWHERRGGALGRTLREHTADVVACVGRGGHHVIREADSELDLYSRRSLRLCVSPGSCSASRRMLRVQQAFS